MIRSSLCGLLAILVLTTPCGAGGGPDATRPGGSAGDGAAPSSETDASSTSGKDCVALPGQVLLAGRVSREGVVTKAWVLDSKPAGICGTQAAIDAFLKFRYRALAEGEPDYPDPVKIAIPIPAGTAR